MAEKRAADTDLQEGGAKRPRPESKVTSVGKPSEPIDRMKKCPLLLRMFPRNGGHNRVGDYQRGIFPPNELSVHTWMDADLREIAGLIQTTQSTARHKDAEMEFALVFPDKAGKNVMRMVGTVKAQDEGDDDAKSLKDIKFQTGDYMDVAILLPKDKMAPARDARSLPLSRGRGVAAGGGRPGGGGRPWR